MRAGFHEHACSGAHPEVNQYSSGYGDYRGPPQAIPYDTRSYPHRMPPVYDAPPPYPSVHPPLTESFRRPIYPEEPYDQRPVYPDERNYPASSGPYDRAHYHHERPSHQLGPQRHLSPRDYSVDTYGRPYPPSLSPRDYAVNRGSPVSYHGQGNISPHNKNLPHYSPQLGYKPITAIGPPGVHLPGDPAMGGSHQGYYSHANGRVEMGNSHKPGLPASRGAPEYINGRPPEYSSVPQSTKRMPANFRDPQDNDDDDAASSLDEPYDGRYEDDDTIATQDVVSNGIDFLNMDTSKRPNLNLDLNQLEIVGEDEHTPEPIHSTRNNNPLDPRRWYVLPPPNRISILKGTIYARNCPNEHSVTFGQCDVMKVGEADYMYGVPDEVVWWTKAELNNRVIEDDNDRVMNPIAQMYDHECAKAYGKLQERVKKALDRNRNSKPNIAGLWNDAKLAKLIKQPIMTGLAFGHRGMELGGMAGRRLRARGHLEMIQVYTDESTYRTKRKARTARRGDAMSLASEEYTLICRLWARAIALADQASANVAKVVTPRELVEI